MTEGRDERFAKRKLSISGSLRRSGRRKTAVAAKRRGGAYKFRIQHPTTKEPHEFRYSPASGENLGEAGKEFLIQKVSHR